MQGGLDFVVRLMVSEGVPQADDEEVEWSG